MSETRTCKVCRTEKPLTPEFFGIKRSCDAGLAWVCKDCKNAATRERYKNETAEQRERRRANQAAWYDANQERLRKIAKAWSEKNKVRRKAAAKDYYQRTKEHQKKKNRINDLKREYGLTQADVDAMFDKQGGKCPICDTAMDRATKLRIPHVDHNHVTGRVRALLCGRCNSALGLFRDDVAVVRAAANYLEEHNDGS